MRSQFLKLVFVFSLILLVLPIDLWAQSSEGINVSINMGSGSDSTQVSSAVKIFLFLTLLSLGPAILLTMTSFTRIVIVLSFLRQAIGAHQSPPNQVLIGLAFFLTIFLMTPVLQEINDQALTPLFENKINHEEAFDRAVTPLKGFMFKQTRKTDLELMLNISKQQARPKNLEELSLSVLMPSFILSELRTAFEIGFLLYLPFVLIDMVVAMILLTMGMLVLPPMIISLPFKLMLFVLVDGWNLIVVSLMEGFR